MKHTYSVTGMTCNGCKAKVESLLKTVEHVESVSVDLDKGQAEVTMSKHITLGALQKALPEKYTISETKDTTIFNAVSTEEPNEWKQLFPLFLIFGYLLTASILLNYKTWGWDGFMLDFMGLFYIVFSFFKLLDLKGFPESFQMYDPLAKVLPVYGWVYPFIETALGLMFLMRFEIPIALMVTLVILGVTTVGVTKVLLDKKSIQCACLGTALKLPMTKATFIENSIMIAMAIAMLTKLYS
ncbi:MAG: cation transporter [Flavobacteriaceae bacterium]